MRKSQLKKSILIVRLSSVGDVVLASPIAEILKRHNPNARIVWAVQPESKPLLENNPHIDDVFVWNKDLWLDLWRRRRFKQLWREIMTTRDQLTKEKFETAFDLQGLFKSGFITWLSGATERVGIGSREGSYWFMHKMVSRNIANRDQLGSEYRYLINQMGYEDGDWNINIVTPESARQTSAEAVEQELGKGKPYIVICPFASSEQKEWSDEYWQQLILRIRGRYHLNAVVLGGKHEGTKGQQLARKCGAVNLAGQTGLQEAAEIIKRAQLVIGVDNGLTHISQSLSVPALALFGPTRPYLSAGNKPSKVIYLDRYCSPCGRKPSCGKSYDCMREINPDFVLSEVKVLLKNTNTTPQEAKIHSI